VALSEGLIPSRRGVWLVEIGDGKRAFNSALVISAPEIASIGTPFEQSSIATIDGMADFMQRHICIAS
jgi:hypothetical protein